MLFLKAVLLGLAVAAPLGPISALCVARTLQSGFAAGFAGGVGTALADALFALAAAFGFAALAGLVEGGAGWVRGLGGLLLIGLALRGWWLAGRRAPGAATLAPADARSLLATGAATFALTLANPATILSFVGLFAGLGLGDSPGWAAATQAVSGVFIGSLLWWAALSGAVALTRRRLPPGFARRVAQASAVMLLALGLWALLPLL